MPEAHTDFTFAVFGEEFGLIGVLLMIGIYFLIVRKGIGISLRTKEPFFQSLAMGITALFGTK